MSGPAPRSTSSLFRIVNGFRYFGLGTKVTRNIYKFPDTYYIITKIKLSTDQAHGKVWGRMVWRGVVKEKDEKIPGPLKDQWQLVATPKYSKFKGTSYCVQKIIDEAKAVEKPYGRLAQETVPEVGVKASA